MDNAFNLKQAFWAQNANWVISVSHKACILLFLASMGAILIRWGDLPTQVPLWYGKPWGNERLAEPGWLYLLPIGSISWHIVNTFIGLFITRDYLVFTQLLFITSVLVSTLAFVTLTKILFIIT